jgi:hypothetical protein
MILPVVLDTCTIINLLRIDEDDEFLFKKLKDLNLNISDCVYNEVQKNVNLKTLTKEQRDYITQQLPSFATHIINPDKKFENDYFDELKSFCNYTKENGELHSTLLSLHICRKESTRLFFYTDDFPAKKQFSPYFSYQQIGTIGDSVDLLLFLFWSISDFNEKRLKKYLQNLYSEYATQLKIFSNKIERNKDSWLKSKPKDAKLRENLSKIEKGCSDLNFEFFNEAVTFFKMNKSKYKEINDIIKDYPDIDAETEITVKIKDIRNKLDKFKICKRLC